MPAEQIAQLFVEEINVGMDLYSFEGPVRETASAKAGLIKVASDYQRFSAATRVAFEAAGVAHLLTTGAPILTHTEMGTMAQQQLDLLLGKYGVSPWLMLCFRTWTEIPDWKLHRDIAQTGKALS